MSKALLICLLASLSAAPALAQAAPASDNVMLSGPQIPGVCYLSQPLAVASSKVGAAATARLQQLGQQVQSELAAEGQPLETERRTLAGERATLKPSVFEQKERAWGERYNALRDKAALRQRQIEATRVKALNQIWTAAVPVLSDAYKAHGCGLLLDRSAVLGGNMTGDLTSVVAQGLDAKMTTITFDLEPPSAIGGAQ